MFFNYPVVEVTPAQAAQGIVDITKKWHDFWHSSHGWAPDSAAALLTKPRLARQHSVAKTLPEALDKLSEASDEGHLLMAWTILGALEEGALKMFFCVYYADWENDPQAPKLKSISLTPVDTFLERLITFAAAKDLFDANDVELMRRIQAQRNLVHAFKDGEVLGLDALNPDVVALFRVFESVEARLPYP